MNRWRVRAKVELVKQRDVGRVQGLLGQHRPDHLTRADVDHGVSVVRAALFQGHQDWCNVVAPFFERRVTLPFVRKNDYNATLVERSSLTVALQLRRPLGTGEWPLAGSPSRFPVSGAESRCTRTCAGRDTPFSEGRDNLSINSFSCMWIDLIGNIRATNCVFPKILCLIFLGAA